MAGAAARSAPPTRPPRPAHASASLALLTRLMLRLVSQVVRLRVGCTRTLAIAIGGGTWAKAGGASDPNKDTGAAGDTLEARLARAADQGNTRKAREILTVMRDAKQVPSPAMWRSVIAAHLKAFELDEASAVLQEMRNPRASGFAAAVQPDAATYELLINAQLEAGDRDAVARLCRDMPAGSNIPWPSLVRAHIKAADPRAAERVLADLARPGDTRLAAGLVRPVLEAYLAEGDERAALRVVALWRAHGAATGADALTSIAAKYKSAQDAALARVGARVAAALIAGGPGAGSSGAN